MQEISYNMRMRTQDDIRAYILKKSQEGSDSKGALAEWSRAMGRNHAYLHQFIHRGSPRKLDEDDRAKLADAMGVPETELMIGAPEPAAKSPPAKIIKSRTFKFYVEEWREFMGVSKAEAAKAVGMDEGPYGVLEFYPVNFTVAQLRDLAELFGVRGDQFWFPPPKNRPAAAPSIEPTAKRRAR